MAATTDVEQLARRVLAGARVEIYGQREADEFDEKCAAELYMRIRAELMSTGGHSIGRRKEELIDVLVLTICLVTASHQPKFHVAPELFPRLRSSIKEALGE